MTVKSNGYSEELKQGQDSAKLLREMRDFICNLRCVVCLGLLVSAIGLTCQEQSQTLRSAQDTTFRIVNPLKFRGKEVAGTLRKSEIESLLDLPVRNGNLDEAEGYGVEMTRENGQRFRVLTCREWGTAVSEGAFTDTTYTMSMEGQIQRTCELLTHLQDASLPNKSFVKMVNLTNLELLPANMLSGSGGEETDRLERLARRGKTVSGLVRKSDIQQLAPHLIRLEYSGLWQTFWEEARADFNHDALEDILVFTGARAVGGTMVFSHYLLLRTTAWLA